MPRRINLKSCFLVLVTLLLTACFPERSVTPDPSEIATLVAEVLTAEAEPGDSPADGTLPEEPEPQENPSIYSNCVNTDLFTVAYVKESNAWLWIEGGDNYALTESGDVMSVRIANDGCYVAYARNVPIPDFDPENEALVDPNFNELWVVSSDGAINQKIAGVEFFADLPVPEGAAGLSLYKYAWQPGNHILAFSTQVVSYGLLPLNDIYLADTDSGTINTLLAAGEGGDFYFSPDGQQLAFTTPNSINAINTDSSNLRLNLLNYEPVITYSEYQYYARPYWGQDSSALMVAIPPADGLTPTADGFPPETAIWRIPLDDGVSFQTVSLNSVWFVQFEPQFSPDLSKVAYLHPLGEPADNTHELVIAGSEGGPEIAVIQNANFGDWSPGSDQFIYWTNGDGIQLWLGSAAGGASVPLPDLTGFAAVTAVIDWTNGPLYLQALQGNQITELSWVNTDGIGIVLDTYPGFSGQFDSTP